MKVKFLDIITMGFALFAMFFGSGNVIFPPYLGMQTAPNWFISVCVFLFVDVILAIFAIVVMARNDEGLTGITQRIGKIPSTALNIIIILCIGPMICIPRSAAVAFDLFMVPVFDLPNNGWEQIVFSAVFMLVTWCLVVRPSKIVDIVGKILTPLLLLTLGMLIFKGIIDPTNQVPENALEPNAVAVGIVAGYQSMDMLGALSFGSILITTAFIKGYKTPSHRVKILSWSAFLTLILLFTTSAGMAYLGSQVAVEFSNVTSQALLVAKIAQKAFSFGALLLGIVASLACLTTAIGLVSGTAVYFKNFTKNKKGRLASYEAICTIVTCVGFVISNLGLEQIINLATPILTLVFPMVVVLVFLSWFNTKIKSNRVFIVGSFSALISNALILFSKYVDIPLVGFLPLAEYEIGWIIPAIIGIAIGFLVGRGHDDRMSLKIYKYNIEHPDEAKGKNQKVDPVDVRAAEKQKLEDWKERKQELKNRKK